MKRILCVCFTMLATFIPFNLHGQPRKVFKFGTLAPDGSTWLEQWNVIAREIETRTGTIKIKTYGGGVLGDENDMFRLMKTGQLQIAGFTVLGLTKAVPEMYVFELPFLFRSYDEIDYVVKTLQDDIQKLFNKRGFYLLAFLDQGFVKIYSKNVVQNLEDLRTSKVWVWSGEEIATQTFKYLGINPIPLPVPDVYLGLQSGIIDVIYTTPLACVTLQWFNNINYVIDIDLRYEPGAVFGTLKYWNALTEREKEITLKAADIHLQKVKEAVRLDQKKSLDEMLKRGKKLIKFKEKDIKEMKKIARKMWYDLADKLYPRWFLDKIIKTLEKYRRRKK